MSNRTVIMSGNSSQATSISQTEQKGHRTASLRNQVSLERTWADDGIPIPKYRYTFQGTLVGEEQKGPASREEKARESSAAEEVPTARENVGAGKTRPQS